MTEHAPLIIDIAGTELTATDRRRLVHPLVGGIILFARNWVDRAQLLQLTSSIKAVRDDLLICVDHEGGRVQRFRTDGFTHLPPMRALGDMWMDDGKGSKAVPGSGALRATNAATAAGYVLGSELRACGVDFSFTPVLDLDWGESGVIGDRAFHCAGTRKVVVWRPLLSCSSFIAPSLVPEVIARHQEVHGHTGPVLVPAPRYG